MSYSDDLDWLARNVHKWPFGLQSYIYVITFSDGVRSWGGNVLVQANKHLRFDKEEWLARRAELQNKPSWADAPEWASYLSQSDSGAWHWFDGEPEINEIHDSGEFWSAPGYSVITDQCGEVLGDWRDTLEQRPDMHKTTPEIDTSAERVQKSAESMGKWHERGDLPPVGTKCEYRLSTTSPWYPCEIKYVIHDDGVVMMREDGFEQFCSINSKLQPVSFRPIRTERDDAIEAMKDHCPYPGSWETTYRLFAESLYDAGYRAGGSE